MTVMHCKSSGEIAVFLSLVLSILILFVAGTMGGVQQIVYRERAEMAVEAALLSCFAEYNKQLYDNYGLMLVDTSYKTLTSGDENFKNHFETYLCENLYFDGSDIDEDVLEIESIDITDIKRCADNEWEYLFAQVSEEEWIERLMSDEYFINSHLFATGEDNDDLESLEDQDISRGELSQMVQSFLEEDIRDSESPGLELDKCIYAMDICVTLRDGNGTDFSISRHYEYS